MIRNTSSQAMGKASSSARVGPQSPGVPFPAARRSRAAEAGGAARVSAATLGEEELDILGLPLQADRLTFHQPLPGADILGSFRHDRAAIGQAAVKLHDVAQVLQEDE